MTEEQIAKIAYRLGHHIAAEAQNIGLIDLAYIRKELKEALALQCEELGKQIYNEGLHTSSDSGSHKDCKICDCFLMVKQKSKELRGE